MLQESFDEVLVFGFHESAICDAVLKITLRDMRSGQHSASSGSDPHQNV